MALNSRLSISAWLYEACRASVFRYPLKHLRCLSENSTGYRDVVADLVCRFINYDIPQFCDDYIHRVGRTGRMGREGVAFTFVTPEEGNELTRIEMRIDRLLKRDEIRDAGSHADTASKAGAAPPPDKPPPEPEPPKALLGRRPPRRYRRAL